MFIARHIVGNILRLSYFFLAKATITMARKPQQKSHKQLCHVVAE